MFSNKVILLAAAMATAPIAGVALEVGAATPAAAEAKPSVSPAVAPPLSPAAQGVVKLVESGTSEEVLKAYIDNTTTAFNLTSDNVIDLQKRSVPSALISSMLMHDKKLREEARTAAQAPSTNYPAPPPLQSAPAQVDPQTALPNDEEVYYNLEPYGAWNYQVGYGWGWQPYASVSYSSYPWGWLGYGYWSCLPNRGWCWFPRSHFRHFEHFYGTRGPTAFGRIYGYDRFGNNGRFGRSAFVVNPPRSVRSPFNAAPGFRQGARVDVPRVVNAPRSVASPFNAAPGFRQGRFQRGDGTVNATRPGFNGPPATQFTTPFQNSGFRASAGGFIQTGNGNAGVSSFRNGGSAFRSGGPVGSFRAGAGAGGFRGGGGGGFRGGGGAHR